MPQQQDTRPNLNESINQHMNLLLFICHAWALVSLVILRKNMGSKYVGLQALLSLVLILMTPMFAPDANPAGTFVLLGVFLVMCFISRCQVLRRRARGDPLHRYDSGTPRLLRLFPRMSETKLRRMEPFLVFFGAILLLPLSQGVGVFFIGSAAALAVVEAATEAAMQERVAAMRDKILEQRHLVEMFRRR